MNIIKSIIRIDINDYISGIKENPEFIDGSKAFLESSEELIISSFETIEEAEAEIDSTVYLTISEEEVMIKYEYISEAETVYFNKVNFMGNIYPLTKDFKSAACYKEIIKHLNIK